MLSTHVLNSRIRVSLIFIKILKFNMIASSLQLATQGLSPSQLVAASILQDKNLEVTPDFFTLLFHIYPIRKFYGFGLQNTSHI